MSDYRWMLRMLDEYQAPSVRKSTAKESPFTITKYSNYFGINSMQDVCDLVEKTIIRVIPAGEQKENSIFLASRSNIVKILTFLLCRSCMVQLLIQRIWLCRSSPTFASILQSFFCAADQATSMLEISEISRGSLWVKLCLFNPVALNFKHSVMGRLVKKTDCWAPHPDSILGVRPKNLHFYQVPRGCW